MAPDVSVIVPTFDRVALLPRALASALSQTGPALEVLVADDGSTDGTAGALARYASDPRVRVLRLEHGGVCRARNSAVAEARAPLLAFLDSDDEWAPGKLAAQCALLRETGLAICQTGDLDPQRRTRQSARPLREAWGRPFRAFPKALHDYPFLHGHDAATV